MEDIKYYLEIAKEETKLAFSNNKGLLFLSIILFVIPMIIGYFYADAISEYISPMVDAFEQQVQEGTITNITKENTVKFKPFDPTMLNILENGGLVEQYLKNKGEE